MQVISVTETGRRHCSAFTPQPVDPASTSHLSAPPIQPAHETDSGAESRTAPESAGGARGEATGTIANGAAVRPSGSLRDRLRTITHAAANDYDLLARIVSIINSDAHPEFIGVLRSTISETETHDSLDGLLFPAGGLNRDVRELCLHAGRDANRSGHSCVRRRSITAGKGAKIQTVTAVPLCGASARSDSIVCLHGEGNPYADRALMVLELVAAEMSVWQLRQQHRQSESEARCAAALVELIAHVEAADSLNAAGRVLVEELNDFLGASQVILGLCRHPLAPCRVFSISGVAAFDPQTEPVRFAEAVLQESIARRSLCRWPAPDDGHRHGLLAHRQFAKSTGVAALISTPLHDSQGELRGAMLLVRNEDEAQSDSASRTDGESQPHADLQSDVVNFLTAAERRFGSMLYLLIQVDRSRWLRWTTTIGSTWRTRRMQTILATVSIVLAALLIPLTYTIDCDCELQPVKRRYVAAPFDGPLERALVEPGDLVTAGTLLARMDGREVRWELAGTQADVHRADTERNSHMATGEYGEAQIAGFEKDRLKQRENLLQHRGDHLEIRSPIDGIVVTGDLERAEGVPLKIGQTLFEIAPLDRMVVEVAIAEDDVSHVCSGQPVRIVLDSFPSRRFEAKLTGIHPRSELRRNENVFIAEVELANDDRLLRPGMEGRATIAADRHSLGWNLFHKAWDAALQWVGW